MNNNKQTAVEWLIEQISYDNGFGARNNSFKDSFDLSEYFEQAKAIEKEQIKDAYKFGISDEYVIGAEQYYNETYGGNNE